MQWGQYVVLKLVENASASSVELCGVEVYLAQVGGGNRTGGCLGGLPAAVAAKPCPLCLLGRGSSRWLHSGGRDELRPCPQLGLRGPAARGRS